MQNVFIYAIRRTETGDAYIGSSITPQLRWIRHRSQLKLNKHHSTYLQNAWNKYGKGAFSFEIIDSKECKTHAERLAFELSWVAKAGKYNVLISSMNESHFVASPESKQRRSKDMLDKIHSDPAYKAFLDQRGSEMAALQQSTEGRANMAKHTKRRWQDPEERRRLRSGLDRKDPESEKRRSENIGKAHSTPEMKAFHRANHAKLLENPEIVAKMRAGSLKRWSDPEAKAKQAEKMRAAHARRKASQNQDAAALEL